MQLLQLHQYLSLLDGGVATEPASPSLTAAALEAAESLWPQLRLGHWSDHRRHVDTVTRCTSSGARLAHVTANWKNCFLILVFPAQSDVAQEYLLLDIGAEYTETQFVCPTFGIEEPATQERIAEILPQLSGREDPFAILDSGDGTYMQTFADGDAYFVEHQLVSLASHYQLPEPVDAAKAVELFQSYAFGRKEWARQVAWIPQQL